MLAVGVREEANSAFSASTIVILYTKPYLYKYRHLLANPFPLHSTSWSNTRVYIATISKEKKPREKNSPNQLCHHLTEEESVLTTQQKVAVAGHLSPASSMGIMPLALRTSDKP